MALERTIRGPFVCFRPIGEVSAAFILDFKNAINDDLLEGKKSIAIDLRKTNSIDGTGFKFFNNLQVTLSRVKRRLAFFGGDPKLNEILAEKNKNWVIFSSLFEFERSFHEIPPSLRKNFFEIGNGTGQIRSLELFCPICGSEKITGFVDLPEGYAEEWVEYSITPTLVYDEDLENALDPERYRVSVCQSCLYASDRLDWFDVKLGDHVMESHLTHEQIERISNKIVNRKPLFGTYSSLDQPHFFGLPRETKAAYISWHLNEMTYRDIAKDKGSTDAFQMAYSHFMMCKFTEDEEKIASHLSTALAWLNGLVLHRELYASYRVLQAKVYALSIYLFLGKFGEALKIERDIMREWGQDPYCEFWVLRARELIDEERAEMENKY